jgi:RND family efflux transporter MFP subunit
VVTAKTNGVVTFASNSVFEGKTVVVGQVICSVSGKDFADNNLSVRITEAKNNYEMTKLNYERAQSLVADKVVSEKELLVTKNAYENAKIVYNQLVENFDADGQRLKAPIDGFIKQIFVKNGGYVEAGQPIMIVAKDNYLMLRAEVRQKYASLLPNVHSAVIFNSVTQKKYTLEELQGAVVSYGKAATGGNFMIPVTLKIKNKGDFVVGSFVDVFLKVRSHTDAITVPNSALMEDQGIYYVFVQVTPELFDKQVVRVGATDGLRTEIVSGLTEEQRVVSKGAILIKLAQATGKLDAHSGHAH